MAEHTAYAGAGGLRPELATAVAGCFDAVINPQLWPDATEALAGAMGALGACFHPFGTGDRRMRAPMSHRYRDMLDEFIAGGWAEQDVRARGWPLVQRGRVTILENDLSTPDERARMPLYTELFRRHDLDTIASVAFRASGQLWVMNVVRSRTMGDYGADTAQELTRLAPQLSRLLTFAEVMAHSAAQGAMAVLERSATGAILVDWTGQVVEMNKSASDLLGSGLAVRNGRLCADWPAAQTEVEALLAWAIHQDSNGLGASDGPVVVPTMTGGMLLVDAIPARGQMADAFGRSGALVLVTDPGRRPAPSQALLRRLYGLTHREAEVAELVAAGEGVGEISDSLGLMASSVRQLIKTLLWKTGTSRQSELVALLSRLPDSR